jgi:hypothetical protein
MEKALSYEPLAGLDDVAVSVKATVGGMAAFRRYPRRPN